VSPLLFYRSVLIFLCTLGHNGNGNLTPDDDLPADDGRSAVDDEANDIDERRSDSSHKSEVG